MEVLKFIVHSCGQLHKPTVGKDVSRPVQFHGRLLCKIDKNNDSEKSAIAQLRV